MLCREQIVVRGAMDTSTANEANRTVWPPLGRGLPLLLLVGFAVFYAAVAVSACLVPVGGTLRNTVGSVAGNDFLTFYAASKLVHMGSAAAVFDQAQFFALQDSISGIAEHFPWAYPPLFLLVVAPLAMLPYTLALAAWLGLTSVSFGWIVRKLSGLALPIVMVLPPLVQNAIDGQNGALTAALFAGGIAALANRRPILSGLLFGCLAYKPQVFALVPICLIAARQWKALAVAVATSALLALASLAIFGLDIWFKFASHLADHMHWVLDGRLPSNRFPTTFIFIYKLTGSAGLAKIAQSASSLFACGFIYWVWRNTEAILPRVLAFCIAMPLATPFMLEYDLAIWALPAAMIFMQLWRAPGQWADWAVLAVLLFLPPAIWYASRSGMNVWAPFIMALVPYVWALTLRSRVAPRFG
jgi:hypothetical protein